jgi:hypothetical protein
MNEQKDFPISEALKIIEGRTIYKSGKWWSAVILLESFGRKQIATYLWNKRNGKWKRRQKFVVHNQEEWSKVKGTIEELLPRLS